MPLIPKPIVKIFSQRYIAGEKLNDAVEISRRLNKKGIMTTIDFLGEEIKTKEEALKVLNTYKEILKVIAEEKIDANISLKPTHLGLKLDKELAYNNIRELVIEAQKYNNFVRIDMEDSSCTDDTLEIFSRLKKEFNNVGTVIQAYLRRTIKDVNNLIEIGANLRLCKGIYIEPRKIAWKDKEIINKNFSHCLEKLFLNRCYVGVATHDEKLVWECLSLVDKYGLKKDEYEFQMLLGVDHELRDIIVSTGNRLRIYVPFGKDWYKYSVRRLKENPNIVSDIVKSIFNPYKI